MESTKQLSERVRRNGWIVRSSVDEHFPPTAAVIRSSFSMVSRDRSEMESSNDSVPDEVWIVDVVIT